MQYAILFQDTVVEYSAFEEPNALFGLAEGRFEPTPGFEQLRPLLQALEREPGAADDPSGDDWLMMMNPAVEKLPLRVADEQGRVLNARVCGLGAVAGLMTAAAWINDAAFWRAVAES